ncbi:hypothetical protein PMKS-003737 [Pichia membranifaciens]|uniref:Uncharacterized protein n=1 Tax=Pichia membranifaciens TaxID=4926 RepID=A0A1Q2YL03_9ASCO|nr:hypothetical protein PMKS-003737 [Pichia membranifaciens]
MESWKRRTEAQKKGFKTPMASKETSTIGASPSEQLLEAARRNNTDLLQELLSKYHDKPQAAIELINTAKDSSGIGALHLAAKYGNYEVMDQLLDIEGVDVNIKATLNGNTPLHYAAAYSFEDPEYALFLVNELINCGADPSIRNKENLKPIDIVGHSNEQIKMALESAEYASTFDQNVMDIPEDDDIDEGSDDEGDEDDDEPAAK